MPGHFATHQKREDLIHIPALMITALMKTRQALADMGNCIVIKVVMFFYRQFEFFGFY